MWLCLYYNAYFNITTFKAAYVCCHVHVCKCTYTYTTLCEYNACRTESYLYNCCHCVEIKSNARQLNKDAKFFLSLHPSSVVTCLYISIGTKRCEAPPSSTISWVSITYITLMYNTIDFILAGVDYKASDSSVKTRLQAHLSLFLFYLYSYCV